VAGPFITESSSLSRLIYVLKRKSRSCCIHGRTIGSRKCENTKEVKGHITRLGAHVHV
jgi:hypothetical protein